MGCSRKFWKSPIGRIGVEARDGCVTRVYLPGDDAMEQSGNEDTLVNQTQQQLEEYFAGTRRNFSLPLAPAGTPFMRLVWAALEEIPYGQTVSYQDIAHAVGKPLAARAVGAANHRNPLPIVIPCHRVIGKNGKPVGYGGGLPLKLRLLAHELQFAEFGTLTDIGATPR